MPARKRVPPATTARKGTSKTAARKGASKTATGKRPGRREENKEATRQRIVAAALALFAQHGFDGTTTRAIAKKARVAEGTVFNYFETKEDIALHFFEQEVDHAIASVRANAALRKAPLEEQLFALVEQQIEFIAPYEQFIGAAFVQALRPTSKLAFSARAVALRNRYLEFVQELMEESLAGRRGPAIPHALVWMAPQAFWIYYVGVLLYWLHDSSPAKESTMAFLDRSLRLGVAVLHRGSIA